MRERAERLNYTEFDPFNHGTTSISYENVDQQRLSQLLAVLQNGWGMSAIDQIQQVAEAEKNSNNFRAPTPSGVFLLKESHVNSPRVQDMVNRGLLFLRSQGIAVSNLIVPQTSPTFFEVGGKLYCLYDFIDGEHFDGSQDEISETALNLALLHQAQALLPFGEIQETTGFLIRHDRGLLLNLLDLASQTVPCDDFERIVSEVTDELKEESERTQALNLECLPVQAIHQDIHPHNLLFYPDKRLAAFLDFDSIIISQRARDVAYAMHRLARTYGPSTERKNDIGVDIRKRAEIFLEAYLSASQLTDDEIKALPYLISDHALVKIVRHLERHYLERNTIWDFDLPKKIACLREASLFDTI